MEQALIQTLNSQTRNMQIDAQIITLDDNLTHPYFSSIDMSKDNVSPIGICKIAAPYDNQILRYWNTYIGTIIISFNIKDIQHQNTNSLYFLQEHELAERITNDEYNYSFICKISRVKHKGKTIIVYLEDLGWKFLQKVPREFRDAYIANQPVDKAFQAICEILGVEYAYSIEDLQEYTFGADGYSIQKDGQTIEEVETILSKWTTAVEEVEEEEEGEENDPLDSNMNENPSLIEFDNKNKNNSNYVRNEPKTNTDTSENEEEDEEKQKEEENEKLRAEFEKKIINLFIGNSYYESRLTDNILNYDNITVTPVAPESSNSDISQVDTNTDVNGDGVVNDQDAKQITQNLLNNSTSGIALRNVTLVPSKKTALSYEQVNKMTVKEAQKEAQKTDKYYHTTIVRLRAHAAWGRPIGPNTDYSKYDY